jgi:ATP-dependent Zn protease
VNYARKRLAIHEAGHAVVALHYNLEPAIRSRPAVRPRAFAAGTTHNSPETVGQKLTLLVAGAAACHVFGFGVCIGGADDDFRKFHALCRESGFRPSHRAPYAIGVFSDALRIIESRRDDADAIAEAFYERGELSYDDIRVIVAKAAPLLDEFGAKRVGS